jgi:hypothetical protein
MLNCRLLSLQLLRHSLLHIANKNIVIIFKLPEAFKSDGMMFYSLLIREAIYRTQEYQLQEE